VRADVHRFSLTDPSDVSGLRRALDLGTIDPTTIVAVIGKTHGNGLVNDYTRGYLTLSLSLLIGEALSESAEDIRARIPFVFSGGVEGVLSAHYTVFTAIPEDEPAEGTSLAIGVAFTAPMRASDVGRQAQIDAVAEAVSRARQQAGIAASDVHFVQVKGPAFTLADILEDQAHGRHGQSGQADELRPCRQRFGRRRRARRDPPGARSGSGGAKGCVALLLGREHVGGCRGADQ
jgi:cyanuric acid amidohydrolase